MFTLLTCFYGLLYDYQTRYFNTYADDFQLLRQVSDLARSGGRVFLSFDVAYPLETFHLMFYSDQRVQLLYNLTFLLDNQIHEKDVYVLGRLCERADLTRYGAVQVVLQSKHSRHEHSPEQRRTLFKLHFRDDLKLRAGQRTVHTPAGHA